MNPPCLEILSLEYSYPDAPRKKVLNGISFNIKRGEIVAMLGRNGCGKTTLMNVIAGFLKPTSGKVVVHPSSKRVFPSLVFQESSLLDWKSVAENIEFALLEYLPQREFRVKRVSKVLNFLRLKKYRDYFPGQLSGGLKQRVVLARALAPDPDLILFDEPFSALDLPVKEELMKEIRRIILNQNKSALFITHNIEEALFFADRILIFNSKTRRVLSEISSPFPKNREALLIDSPKLSRYRTLLRGKLSESSLQ